MLYEWDFKPTNMHMTPQLLTKSPRLSSLKTQRGTRGDMRMAEEK